MPLLRQQPLADRWVCGCRSLLAAIVERPLCASHRAAQGQKAMKQELEVPSNQPVGHLRRIVADWLCKQPQYLRLLGGVSRFLA